MAFENKLGITSSPELAEAEEKSSKKKAAQLFEKGLFDTMEAGKFASLKACLLYTSTYCRHDVLILFA